MADQKSSPSAGEFFKLLLLFAWFQNVVGIPTGSKFLRQLHQRAVLHPETYAPLVLDVVPSPGSAAPRSALQPPKTKLPLAAPGSLTPAKKRPYRRTKRPKNYCDKSTVTTMTPTLENQPMNVYDAVLGECEDLLKASVEAHRLGRLKMASAYQLLLHTRLVGLGKRFDRSEVAAAPHQHGDDDEDDDDEDDECDDEGDDHDGSDEEGNAKPLARSGGLKMDDSNLPEKGASLEPSLSTSTEIKPAKPLMTSALPKALEKLTEILPSNLEMDVSMMEHLARAAVELHHQRTGRKKSADGLLASPVGGMIGTASPAPADTSESSAAAGKGNARIAWTVEEQKIVENALVEKKAPYAIAKLLKNKTEAQVKAFIKNQAKSEEQNDVLEDDLGSPSKKRGGRGRKPPTTAMNTMPNANLDAKSLLKGVLKRK